MADGIVTAGNLPALLASALLVALAVWLLFLEFSSSAHRVFALFLVAEAFSFLFSGLLATAPTFERASMYHALSVYGVLASGATLLYFLTVYPRRRTWLARPNGWIVATAVFLALVGLQAAAPGLTYVAGAVADDPTGVVDHPGPLYGLLVGGMVTASSVVAFVLAKDHRRLHRGPQGASLLTMIVGFAIYPVHRGTEYLVGMATRGNHADGPYWPPTWDADAIQLFVFGLVQVIGLGVTLAALRRVLLALPREARRKRRVVWAAVFYGTALGTGRAFGDVLGLPPAFFFGMAVLPLPLLVTYALVRLQLFDIDLKIKWTLRQSTVAAMFVAVFFVVSEASQEFFSARAGSTYLGIGAAAGLVFMMAPLQRLAEKVSEAAMPGTAALSALPAAERRALFMEAQRAAWIDGRLSTDERDMLDRLQRHLGIGDADAKRLEREARS